MSLKRNLTMKCLLLVFSLTLSFNLPSAVADNTKMAIFVAQYKAFRLEFEDFWNKTKKTDLENAKTNLGLQEEFLNFKERLQKFSLGVRRYALEQLKAGAINEVEEHHFALLAARVDVMNQTMDLCSEYLSIKRELYLQTATKYFQILLFLESQKE